jgi:hypothetical protein
MPYLEDHPPARRQFTCPRRDRLRGVIVVHTAESVCDFVGPDTGAENVASFIRGRSTAGSYHDLCDSDSFVNLVSYDCEAYHDGTGSNPWSLGLSFACRTTDWDKMSAAKRQAFIEIGAQRAANMARHVKARTGKIVQPKRLTKAESDQGATGFVDHGRRDPGRRTDPGVEEPHRFPWEAFLAAYQRHAADVLGFSAPPARTTIRKGDEGDDVKFLQAMLTIVAPTLRDAGYGDGRPVPVTGVADDRTVAMVNALERYWNKEGPGQSDPLMQDFVFTKGTGAALAAVVTLALAA